ncbi:MAG: hypothetical protein H6774_00145 [Pseudomonadales bacterium]|nr:hypothetical protein [Candidatus Woesebacteria bacterium]MCB9801485.1 hypothetical protein [Pseudomonadales bacterium]
MSKSLKELTQLESAAQLKKIRQDIEEILLPMLLAWSEYTVRLQQVLKDQGKAPDAFDIKLATLRKITDVQKHLLAHPDQLNL